MRSTRLQRLWPVFLLPFLAAASPQKSQLQVLVMDESGSIVKDAPICIQGGSRGRYIGGKESEGATHFEVNPGHYVLSASFFRETNGNIDRYTSHQAVIQIGPGEIQSVVLTLHHLDDHSALLAYADLRRRGWGYGSN